MRLEFRLLIKRHHSAGAVFSKLSRGTPWDDTRHFIY